jgi:hypothetical protein
MGCSGAINGLPAINATVLTEPINSRMVGNPEVIHFTRESELL